MRALIVDVARLVRSYLRGLLEEKGIECAEASDGQAGKDQLNSGLRFDLALIDWKMPGMNGLDLLKHMRTVVFDSARGMMVTIKAENAFILRALDSGADEYLIKPIDDEALSEKLAMLGLVEA
jgi:two-component system, chemotaxis family, chemotaxis protein CheY